MKLGINSTNKEMFEQFKLGDMSMKNRFVVPSINRMRANKESCVPLELMGQFFTQRYHNGLVITDGCYVNDDYNPFKGLPGLYSEQQATAWVDIVDRVHSRATNFVAQLFHPGRVVSQSQLPSGTFAKGPSEIKIEGVNSFSRYEEFAVPKEMTKDEIKKIVQDFKNAAIRAKNAGFDGIQINAGSGFLIDQFLRDSSNRRKDEYGGSIENRCRFCIEIIDEILTVYSHKKVSLKISPINEQYGMKDSNPIGLMNYLLQEVEKRNLAFVEVRKIGYLDIIPTQQQPQETDLNKPLVDPMPEFFKIMRSLYKGNMVANSDFENLQEAISLVKDLGYQAVAFDILSITNPDIPQRIAEKGNINKNLRAVFLYNGDRAGYVDYPYYIAHSKF